MKECTEAERAYLDALLSNEPIRGRGATIQELRTAVALERIPPDAIQNAKQAYLVMREANRRYHAMQGAIEEKLGHEQWYKIENAWSDEFDGKNP